MAWLLSIDVANIPQRRLSPQNLHKLSKIVREWLEKLVRWKKSGRKILRFVVVLLTFFLFSEFHGGCQYLLITEKLRIQIFYRILLPLGLLL